MKGSMKIQFWKMPGIAIFAALIAALPAAAQMSDAEAANIVKLMETAMYQNAKTEAALVSTADGKTETYGLTSFARDNNQLIIVRFNAPARMVGSDLLMLDRNVWLYDPKSGREMKIPSNQSFGGTGFSYGDVLRLNYSDNYAAKLLSESDTEWKLDLTAKFRDAPYARIELVVGKDNLPKSGKCFTRTGDLIKEMAYSGIGDKGGGKKPLVTTVTSPLNPGDVSVLTITRETIRTYPQNIFNKKNLAARLEDRYEE